MRLNMNGPPLNLIGVYAPHEGRNIEEKEQFYRDINKIYEKTSRQIETIAIGDFNIRFHAKREHESTNLGRWVVGRGNEFMEKGESKTSQATNREQCLDWCYQNWLIHQNSQFQKDIKKKFLKSNWNS